jgi:diguanylate cyclase (GGDEF)-like protein/PAS domain S-box-containing protein
MDRLIQWLFSPAGLTPHGFCLLWQPGLIWTDAAADFATGTAYFAIPIALAVIARGRPEIVFRPVIWLFVAFILLCGITHWLDLLTLWVPVYGLQGAAKAIAATVSVVTAVALCRCLPELIARPSVAEVSQLYEKLRRDEEFLDRIGKVAGVGGWEMEVATGRVTWSSGTLRIHGIVLDYQPTLEESIGFYPPEVRPAMRAALATAIETGQGWDVELPFDRPDGKRIWVRTIGTAAYADPKAGAEAGARPVRITAAFQDVTDKVGDREELRRMAERITLATDSGGIGIWDLDLERDVMVWDAWMFRLHGLPPQQGPVSPTLWMRCLHPEDRARAEQDMRKTIDGWEPLPLEHRVLWDDGSIHHIGATAHVTRDAAGRAIRMIGTCWDVTHPRRLAAELAAQNELLKVTLNSIADGVITTDAQGYIRWLNPMAEKMTGWPEAEAFGRKLPQVFRTVHEETRAPAEDPLHACLSQPGHAAAPDYTLLLARDGAEYGIEHSASPMRAENGEMLGIVLVFHDVTEQRRLAREMSHRTSHDLLTGLVNRAEFEMRLGRVLEQAHMDNSENALLFIDLDEFKIVNDSCGHAVGDQLLIQFARLLTDVVQTSDTVARLGGDEFAVLLEHCPFTQALRIAQRICDRMEDFRFIHEDKRFRIGASIGLVPVDSRWMSTAAVRQAADGACYAAKEGGRNRVHLWSESDAAMQARNGEMQWATRLAAALDEDRFLLFLQRIEPLQAIQQGLHAEILLRLPASEDSLVLPGAFMPAAERFHMATRIDRWVLRQVVRRMQVAAFRDRFEKIGVNISGQSVCDRSFHSWAVTLLEQAGPEICCKLCLEITETVAITNFADAAMFTEKLRALRVRVALDDFGAGASSFRYLTSMPVDIIKIDGQFIRDLLVNPLSEAAVRCFIDVAHVANLTTVAEFVDHPDVLRKLRQMGVDFAQGNLIHRPEPIASVMTSFERVGYV